MSITGLIGVTDLLLQNGLDRIILVKIVIVSHTFSKAGTFIVKCQAKDSYDSMSDWGELEVTMPTVTSYISSLFFDIIERLMERFPYASFDFKSIAKHLNKCASSFFLDNIENV